MTELSPDAQAKKVLDAFVDHESFEIEDCLAAALRALADQVVPKMSRRVIQDFSLLRDQRFYERQEIRSHLLAIAAELKGSSD